MSVANIFNPGTTIIGKDYLPNPYPWGGGGGGGGTPTLESVLATGNDANKLVMANASELEADTVKCDLIEPGIDALTKVVRMDAELNVKEGIVADEGVVQFELCNGIVNAGPAKDITVQAGDNIVLQGTTVALQANTIETSTRLKQTNQGEYALYKEVASPPTKEQVENSLSTWATNSNPVPAGQFLVAYSPELNLYVSVGQSGRFLRSSDAMNWIDTNISAVSSLGFTNVEWSPQLGLFVACSYQLSGVQPQFVKSSDGITWTACTGVPVGAQTRSWEGVAWSPDVGLFVAVAYATPGGPTLGVVMTSPDGDNWTEQNAPSYYWYNVYWLKNLFIAVGYGDFSGPGNNIMTSPDGIVWTMRTSTFNIIETMAYSPDLDLFVGTGSVPPATGGFTTSTDGITWVDIPPPGGESPSCVVWLPYYKVFLAFDYVANLLISYDGFTWTANGTTFFCTNAVAVGPTIVAETFRVNNFTFVAERPVLVGSTNSNLTIQTNSTGAGGKISFQGGTDLLTIVSGPASGQFLVVNINGNNYKIRLFNP